MYQIYIIMKQKNEARNTLQIVAQTEFFSNSKGAPILTRFPWKPQSPTTPWVTWHFFMAVHVHGVHLE